VIGAGASRMTVAVRPLAPGDAGDEALVEELVRVINEAYAIGEAGLWVEGATRTGPDEIAGFVRSGGMLAATVDGRLVGCAYLRPLDAHTADLGLISTAADHWGRGVGTELVRFAEELARSRGVKTMQLDVLVPKDGLHPAKVRLRDWYTRLGYAEVRTAPFEEVVGHLAPKLAGPSEFLIFHKRLTG
jgi:GNAT superfamily N-acetyltransferase